MSLYETTIQRLAFIKAVYSSAVNQSLSPEPLNCMSLLSFHDAIELFLQLGSEHLGANASNANFLDYWEIISKKTFWNRTPTKRIYAEVE